MSKLEETIETIGDQVKSLKATAQSLKDVFEEYLDEGNFMIKLLNKGLKLDDKGVVVPTLSRSDIVRGSRILMATETPFQASSICDIHTREHKENDGSFTQTYFTVFDSSHVLTYYDLIQAMMTAYPENWEGITPVDIMIRRCCDDLCGLRYEYLRLDDETRNDAPVFNIFDTVPITLTDPSTSTPPLSPPP